jgi:hypothetical protein
LDQLAGLEQIIRPEDIQYALTATVRSNSQACSLTYELVLQVVLARELFTHLPTQQVFKHACRLRAARASPHHSSLCIACRRLGIAPLWQLFIEVVRPLAGPDAPGPFYCELRLMGIDGVALDVCHLDVKWHNRFNLTTL